jgi:hypothetical protein
MFWEIITSATVSGLLIWLMREWISERLKNAIKHEYDQKLETHKAQLKAQSDVEIEKLRSQLTITATEHEVRFSSLHEKRAKIIAETYALLKLLFVLLRDYEMRFQAVVDDPSRERRESVTAAYRKFHDYYITKVIFFPKDTAKKLDDIDSQLLINYNKFMGTVEMSKGSDINSWIQNVKEVEEEIKTALNELEDEFRRILGDEC